MRSEHGGDHRQGTRRGSRRSQSQCEGRESAHRSRRRPLDGEDARQSGNHANASTSKRQRYSRESEEPALPNRGRSPQLASRRRDHGRESNAASHRKADTRQPMRQHARRNDKSRGEVRQDGDDIDSYCSEELEQAPRKNVRPPGQAPPRRDVVQSNEDAGIAPRKNARKSGKALPRREIAQNNEDEDMYSYYSDDVGPAARQAPRPHSVGKAAPRGRCNSEGSAGPRQSSRLDVARKGVPNGRRTTGRNAAPQNGRPNGKISKDGADMEYSYYSDDDVQAPAVASARPRGDQGGTPNGVHGGVDFRSLLKGAKTRLAPEQTESLADALKKPKRTTNFSAGAPDVEQNSGSRAKPPKRQCPDEDSLSADLSGEETRLGVGLAVSTTAASVDVSGTSRSSNDQRKSGFGWTPEQPVDDLVPALPARARSDTAQHGGQHDVGVRGVGASGIDFDLIRSLGRGSEPTLPVPFEPVRQLGRGSESTLPTPKNASAVRPVEEVLEALEVSVKKLGSEYFEARMGTICGPEDRFIVQELLGRGAFSSVFRCEDARVPGLEYAIKFSKQTQIAANAQLRDAMKKEIKLLGSICTQIVEKDPTGARNVLGLMFLDGFEHEGHIAMVFELMKCSLRTALGKYTEGRGFPFLPTVRSLSSQLFLALRALRRVEVIHCDVKPENILLSRDRKTIKLSDFGCARRTADCEKVEYLQSGKYRAPEVILGQPFNFKNDIWSAGATIFELATGAILFNGKSNCAVIHEILKICGAFPIHVTVGCFAPNYFSEDTGDFMKTDSKDTVAIPMLQFVNPSRPLSSLLDTYLRKPSQGVDPSRHKELVAHFGDLLKKCLMLDPAVRATAEDALGASFFVSGASGTLV